MGGASSGRSFSGRTFNGNAGVSGHTWNGGGGPGGGGWGHHHHHFARGFGGGLFLYDGGGPYDYDDYGYCGDPYYYGYPGCYGDSW